VVVVGLAVGALIASVTTPSTPPVQSAALAQTNQGSAAGDRNGRGTGQSTSSSVQGTSQPQGAVPLVGSVSSRDGNTLTVSTQQGDRKVDVSGAKIQKMVEGTTDDLKTGAAIVAVGQQGQDGVIAATTIQIRPDSANSAAGNLGGQARTQRQAQGESQGQGQGQGQGQEQGQRQGARPVSGSISSIQGDVISVNTQQGEVRVKVTGARIQKLGDATPDDLKAGERVMISGQQGQNGGFSASAVQILSEPAGTATQQ